MQVTKSGKGWRARVRVNGQDRSKSFRTQAEAKAWGMEVELEAMATEAGVAPKGTTFGDLVIKYMAEITPDKRGSRSEMVRLAKLVGQGKDGLIDPLTLIPVAKLSATDFAAWRDRRLKVVTAGSVLREWNTLSAAINWAVKELRWLPANPMKDVKRPAQPAPRTRRVTPAEIDRICHAAGYDDNCPMDTATVRTAAAFMFAIETAMRAGEIVGLTWNSIDMEKRTAHLDRTKNGTARTVPLSKAALVIIERMRGVDDVSVFGLRSDNIDALFRKLTSRALVDGLHFHDTRREALSRLSKKVDVMQLARISGHKDLKILLNTYYQVDMADVALQLD